MASSSDSWGRGPKSDSPLGFLGSAADGRPARRDEAGTLGGLGGAEAPRLRLLLGALRVDGRELAARLLGWRLVGGRLLGAAGLRRLDAGGSVLASPALRATALVLGRR
jgi:hypothetical protein